MFACKHSEAKDQHQTHPDEKAHQHKIFKGGLFCTNYETIFNFLLEVLFSVLALKTLITLFQEASPS